jgi:two-component system response regulator VicR
MLKRVLVMDNDPRILDVMQEALSYEGFAVDAYEGTEDILGLVEQCQPDLIILDYILNGINGGEHCRKLKNFFKTSHLPVIIFSAYPRVLQSLGYYGCNAFIAKPFDLNFLIDKVTELTANIPKTRISTEVNGY